MTRAILAVTVLTLAGCAGLSEADSAKLGRSLRTYVRLVPARATMTAEQLADHDATGEACCVALEAAGGITPVRTATR